jgi:PAS domain S-box-containing protein
MNIKSFFSNTALRYGLAGTGLGLLFPVTGLIVEAISSGLPFTADSLAGLHNSHPVLWVIDLAPILLGLVGQHLGRIRTQAVRAENRLDARNFAFALANDRIAQETELTKRLETVLARDKEEWEAIFDAVSDMIFLVNADGSIVRCNSAVTERLDSGSAQLAGNILTELLFPDSPGNELQIGEIEIKKLGGYFDVSSKPVGTGPAVRHTIYILHDTTQHRLAENKLEDERNLLHTLIDNLPDNVFIKDLDSRYVMNNIEHRRLMGVTNLDQIAGKTDFDFFPQELAALYFADERQVVQSGEALINREEPVLDRKGNQRWLLTTKVPLRDRQGSITGIVGTSHDITERKRLEASLRESERRFRMASWATKDVIWERDLTTNTILWNESVRKIFHFPIDEIEPTVDWWQDHIHPVERNKVINSIQTALEQRLDFWSMEYRFRMFDGSYADIFDRGYIIYNEQAKPVQMMGAMIDVTDKKLAEDILNKERADLEQRTAELGAALRETEELFSTVQAILKSANLTQVCQNLMEHFSDLVNAERIALYLVDHGRQEILLNLAEGNFQATDSLTYQDLKAGIAGQVFKSGQPVLSVAPDDGLEPPETYERRIRDNAGSLIVVPLLTREGTDGLRVIGVVVVINSIGRGVFTPHDKNLLMMMATQAATAVENIHLYEEAQRARDAADAANRSKGDFLANMSHEIRTPMNAILGLTKLVLDMDLDDKQRSYLQKVLVSSKALLGILNDILDYSKIEAGKLDLEEVDFDLDETIRNTIELFSAGAEEKAIELILEFSPEIPRALNGDPLRLGQVLNNLVGNAIKFTEHGEVHIKVEVNKYAGQKIWLQFSVRDSGIGMTESQIERLFHAFNQADTSTTRKFGGTGLGLTISKRLVEIMGGQIGVESAHGGGSHFHFMVPLQAAGSEAPLQQIDQLRSMKTLVVDDQHVFLRIMGSLLSFWSFDVSLASSGEKGLEAVTKAAQSEHPFELILIDWNMPGMDGFELARRIRNSSIQISQPPLIIMVTNGRSDVLRSTDAVQIDALIDKPVTPSTLFDVIVNLQAGTTTKPKTRFQAGKLDLLEITRPIRGAHVLVVEDNLTNQLVAKGFLEKMALLVDIADDGQQAIDKISARDYDVVLMDLQMPNMDGLEATRRIRSMERGRNLPVIAMTAAAMQKDKDESEAAGMNGHIAKPIDVDELISVLMTWVPHHPDETGISILPEDRQA